MDGVGRARAQAVEALVALRALGYYVPQFAIDALRVEVADNYGNDAVVIDTRTITDPGYPSHYKVRTDTGDEFWAFDHEVNEP